MRLVRIYPALARVAWERAQAYRAAFVIALLNAAFPLVMMAIWVELAREAPIGGFSAGDFIGYYLGAVLVRRITAVGIVVELERMIHTGELATYLLRPLHVAHWYLVRALVSRWFVVGVLAMFVVLAVTLTPGAQFDLQLTTLALFALSCALGLLFEFFVQFGLGGLGFWIAQVHGVNAAFQFVKAFFGGYIVPLALFPFGLGETLAWLPFAVSVALPVEILTGRIQAELAVLRLLVGLGWVAAAGLIARQIWRRGLRAYNSAGA